VVLTKSAKKPTAAYSELSAHGVDVILLPVVKMNTRNSELSRFFCTTVLKSHVLYEQLYIIAGFSACQLLVGELIALAPVGTASPAMTQDLEFFLTLVNYNRWRDFYGWSSQDITQISDC
jgi:hypothetical protein